jgi:ActR/RegA family two-component response regulator
MDELLSVAKNRNLSALAGAENPRHSDRGVGLHRDGNPSPNLRERTESEPCRSSNLQPAMPLTTILIEDSLTIRDNLVAAMAELADIEVIATAETPAEAIAALRLHRETWLLAVVDLFLRDGSGMTVLRQFQQRRADQHMVVLTNYPTPEIRRRCLALGADAVFDKSTELDAFFALCNTYGSS